MLFNVVFGLRQDYAFALKKKIVPMMNSANYRPDGWLGILLGSKVPDGAPLLSS